MYVPGNLWIPKDINYKLIVKYFKKEQNLKSFNVNISYKLNSYRYSNHDFCILLVA